LILDTLLTSEQWQNGAFLHHALVSEKKVFTLAYKFEAWYKARKLVSGYTRAIIVLRINEH